MKEREFDTHFVFTVWIHIHGKDAEAAIENTLEQFSDSFVSRISNQMFSLVDYEADVESELNSLYRVALKWSGYWTINAKDKEDATSIAETLLNAKLTPVYQTIESFADKSPYFTFDGNMTNSVEDVIEMQLV